MTKVLNVDASIGANIIGDNAEPTLTLENNSTGSAIKLKNSSTPSANATAGVSLELVATGVASGAVLKITGSQALVSLATIDIGAAVENILLGAINYGIGSCWMANIKVRKIKSLLEVPDRYQVKHVISLGYPDEESFMEPYEDSYKYWKNPDGTMHVPKRDLDDIIYKIF